MIVIVDYEMGNVGSIANMLKHCGIEDVILSNKEKDILRADKLIIPGVGAFDAGMENLTRLGLDKIIKAVARNEKKPILGICLGMQLLGNKSDEGRISGLGLIDFDTVTFNKDACVQDDGKELKIPHMGWDYVEIPRFDSDMVKNLENERQRYYFVHSYHAKCKNEKNVLMYCDYGYRFAAAVIEDNIIGVQFHPEKSHKFGMKLLKNFATM